MASRMERYHQHGERSARNEQLYKNIENLDNYTNIESVIAIDKTNEIDITRVKAMLQGRESYQKEKKYRNLVEEEQPEEQLKEPEIEEEKSYDIKSVLTKAKETRSEPEETYRTLKNTNYDVSEKIKHRSSKENDETLKDLVDIVSFTKPNQTEASALEESGLLDDLKSDTMIGEASSIKKIIEEAKKEEEKQDEEKRLNEPANLANIDKTFYTSSLGFTDKDFEDLKSLEENIKKHNVLLRILIIAVVVVAVLAIAFLIFHFLNQ